MRYIIRTLILFSSFYWATMSHLFNWEFFREVIYFALDLTDEKFLSLMRHSIVWFCQGVLLWTWLTFSEIPIYHKCYIRMIRSIVNGMSAFGSLGAVKCVAFNTISPIILVLWASFLNYGSKFISLFLDSDRVNRLIKADLLHARIYFLSLFATII